MQNDTLTAKFVIEVRPDEPLHWGFLRNVVDVPGPSLSDDTEALLQSGTGSDIQFPVEDEAIPAHSAMLCARSEVFKKLLAAGMQESVSKKNVVEDCDASTFRAFLKFLYTNSLPSAKELMPKDSGSSEGFENGQRKPTPMLASLAVSHKYQVSRLQCWCEQQLCEYLSTSEVCSMLRLAHLFQAKQLERAFLTYIQDHMAHVVELPAYREMMTAWPQIMLKVSRFITGLAPAQAEDGGPASDRERRYDCVKRRVRTEL